MKKKDLDFIKRYREAMELYYAKKLKWSKCLSEMQLGRAHVLLTRDVKDNEILLVKDFTNIYNQANDSIAEKFCKRLLNKLNKKTLIKDKIIQEPIFVDGTVNATDKELVEELRRRGYTVTATKDVEKQVHIVQAVKETIEL